jgi:hypothetical protein
VIRPRTEIRGRAALQPFGNGVSTCAGSAAAWADGLLAMFLLGQKFACLCVEMLCYDAGRFSGDSIFVVQASLPHGRLDE